MPTPEDLAYDLAYFLGRHEVDVDTEEGFDHTIAVINVVTAMAKAYTRDVGFTDGEPNEAIAAVILTAAARLLTNTAQVESEAMGPFNVRYGQGFQGFTIGEQMTLNRYRKRAE